jgi:hypothetical protein
MKEFLKIVENNMPDEERSVRAEMIDMLAKLLDNISSINVVSLNEPDELAIKINENIITLQLKDVKVEAKNTEEDTEDMTHNLDRGVENLAAKATTGIGGVGAKIFGSVYQQAKGAVKERERAAADGIGVYRDVTNSLKDAIRASKQQISARKINVI